MRAFKINGSRLFAPTTDGLAIGAGAIAVPAAGTIVGSAIKCAGARSLIAEVQFVYGSGGTSADVYIQTSFDGGASWVDIMNFHFLVTTAKAINKVDLLTAVAANYTPTDAGLTANTIKDGLLGDRVRAKSVIVGTYAASTLQIDLDAKA